MNEHLTSKDRLIAHLEAAHGPIPDLATLSKSAAQRLHGEIVRAGRVVGGGCPWRA